MSDTWLHFAQQFLYCLTDPECAYPNIKMVYEQFIGKKSDEPIPKTGKDKVKVVHIVQLSDPKQ